MQFLTNALPGFRDLRAPVIAGYLWLIFAWLVVDPNFSHAPKGVLGQAAYSLGHRVGRFGIAVAVSVAAYLVGSVSQNTAPLLRRGWDYLIDEVGPIGLSYNTGMSSVTKQDLESIANRARELSQSRERFYGYQPQSATEEFRVFERNQLEDRLRQAQVEATTELGLPATVLVGKDPELFAEVDRLRAEGELRLAVVPPLLALILLASTMSSLWWLCGIPAVVILLDQGARRLAESRTLIADAIGRGGVKSSAVERFREWVDLGERQFAQEVDSRAKEEAEMRRQARELG
jgi:hypothetical protein